MAITGHRTREAFDRYNIVNEADLRLAASRQEEYLKATTGKETGNVHRLDRKGTTRKSAPRKAMGD